jgi:hypothetical protein
MQKWEYIVLSYIIMGRYMTNGRERPEFKGKSEGWIFNELGNEGWELVLQDKDKNWHFKRPKS